MSVFLRMVDCIPNSFLKLFLFGISILSSLLCGIAQTFFVERCRFLLRYLTTWISRLIPFDMSALPFLMGGYIFIKCLLNFSLSIEPQVYI